MAITYLSQGAGVSTATSAAALSPLCPATVNAGDILIAHCAWNDTSSSPATPSGWTLLYGPQNIGTTPNGRHWVFGKIADGTEDGAAVAFGTAGGTAKRWARVYSFAGRVSGTITDCVLGFAATAHGTDPQMPSITTTKAGSLAVACVLQNDDNAIAAATGMSGGTWVEAVTEYTATTGTGVMMQLETAAMASVGTISGGAVTATNDPSGVIGFEIRDKIPVTLISDSDLGVGSENLYVQSNDAYSQAVLGHAPVAYYKMREESGYIQDSSGNGNHATLISGSPVFGESSAIAVDPSNDKAIRFDNGPYFQIPHAAILNLNDVFTLEAWIKPNTPSPGNYSVFGKGAWAWGMVMDGGGYGRDLRLLDSGYYYTGLPSVKIVDANWHHLVISKNGGTVEVYIDGSNVISVTGSPATTDTTGNVFIGTGPLYPAQCTIDEVAIYSTALTWAQVQQHFDAANGFSHRIGIDSGTGTDVVSLDHIFRADFEGGTDGVTPTTSDAASPTVDGQKWDVVNKTGAATLEYDDTRAASGTKSLKFATPDSNHIPYVEWKIQKGPEAAPTPHYHRCYIWLTGYPVGCYISLPDMSSYSFWSIGPNGMLGFNAQGNLCNIFAGAQCSPALPLNQWIRIETWFLQAQYLVTDRGSAGARIYYTDPFGTTHDAEINTGGGWVLGDNQQYSRWGVYPAAAGSCPEFWLDEIVTGAPTWVGPVVPPGIPKAGADAGSGLDEISYALSVSVDTGLGSEISNKVCEGTDSGVGADTGLPRYVGSDSGAGTDSFALAAQFTLPDTGTSSDTATVPTASDSKADTGVGSDITSLSREVSDTGTGVDVSVIVTQTMVSGSDSGTGTENATGTAPVAGSDSGTGTDAGILVAVYTQSDTGSGADASILTAAYALSDTGSATDAGSFTAPISATDAGTGTETAPIRIALTDTGAGSEVSGISLVLSDTGAGTEVSNISFTVSDTGAGVDAISAFIRQLPETASGLDDPILSAGNDKTGTDSSAGTDASALTAVFTQSDTGAGAEVFVIQIIVSDTGTGAETSIPTRAIVATDSGSGSDSSLLTTGNTKLDNDNALGLEFASTVVALTVSDMGTGSEISIIQRFFLGADTGTGTEIISFSRIVNDFGGATETTNLSAGNILTAGDIGTGSETVNVIAGFSISDAGTGSDTANAIQGLYIISTDLCAGSDTANVIQGTDLVYTDFGIGTDDSTLNISTTEPEYHHSVLIQATGYTSEVISTVRRKPQMVTANGGRSKMSKAQ